MHLQVDSPPPVFADEIGLKLAAPDADWRQRPDMNPDWTRGYRAAIVGRARYVEDLVLEQLEQGVGQYVILGAGLDTFAQRRADLSSRVTVFEIDKPGTQAWKRQRLIELGLGVPKHLRLVPVDFEKGDSWWEKLRDGGFDSKRAAVLASTGVSMYLSEEANAATLRQIAASFAPGSTLAMTFLLTLDLIDPAERAQHEMVYERAKAAGTPFISFFSPEKIVSLARAAGFKKAKHMSRSDLIQRYFKGRTDGLVPGSGEEFLIAST